MSPFAKFLVLLTLTASSAFAFTPALSVPQDLSKRDVNVGGGWPAKMKPCANGTGACNQVGSCCPESLFCKFNDPTAGNNPVGTVCCAEGLFTRSSAYGHCPAVPFVLVVLLLVLLMRFGVIRINLLGGTNHDTFLR
jgi:hypothetical protein